MKFQNAIVIGASSGIGREIALQLGEAGCNVGLVARRLDALEELAAEIQSLSESTNVVVCQHDVRNHSETPLLFQDIAHRLGGLDVMFYVAGVLLDIQPDEYNTVKDSETIDTNLTGAIAWINEAAARFERVKSGTIVAVSSVASARGRVGRPVYGASKAALDTYTEAIRNRVSRYGVRVVTVLPGFVRTPMTERSTGMFLVITASHAAELILKAARSGRLVRYIPERWRIFAMIVKSVPSFIFRRLKV